MEITFSRAAPDEAWDANETKHPAVEGGPCLACPPHNKHTTHTCGTRGRQNPLPRGPRKRSKQTGPPALAELCGACIGKDDTHTCGFFDDNAEAPPVAVSVRPPPDDDDSSDADSEAFGITSFENEEELRKAFPPAPKRVYEPEPEPEPAPSPPRARQRGGQKCGPWFQFWLDTAPDASEALWQSLGDADKRPIRVTWQRTYEESLRASGRSPWLGAAPNLDAPYRSNGAQNRAAAPRSDAYSPSPSPEPARGAGRRARPPGWRKGDASIGDLESDRRAPHRAPGGVPKRYNNDKSWREKKRPRIKDARLEVPKGTRVRLDDPRFKGELGTVVDHKHAWYRIQLDAGGVQSVRVMFLQKEDGRPMHPGFANARRYGSDDSD